jgi:predicted hotdog family 3-hydroxylacyl-ACP dehydratase
MNGFPPVSELVPHRESMLLLDRVLEHEPTHTVCRVDVDHSALFSDSDGRVPSWVGLEYMAQCAAAHGGMAARRRGEPVRPGLLLGTRRLQLVVGSFLAGSSLRVTARHHHGNSGLVAFDCTIHLERSDELLVEGRINLYLLADWSELSEVNS